MVARIPTKSINFLCKNFSHLCYRSENSQIKTAFEPFNTRDSRTDEIKKSSEWIESNLTYIPWYASVIAVIFFGSEVPDIKSYGFSIHIEHVPTNT